MCYCVIPWPNKKFEMSQTPPHDIKFVKVKRRPEILSFSTAVKNCDCLWHQDILQALSSFSTTENGSVQQTAGTKNNGGVRKQERKCSICWSNGCVTL